MKNARIRRRVSAVALNALLAVLAVLWLVPVFWLIVSSFRAEQGAYTPYLWPKAFTFDNYNRHFTDRRLFDFPRWLGNTLLVAGCSCALTTMLTLMVAYVYSRLRFPKRRFLMNASLVLGMFPGFMSIIAIYHFMKAIGLDQTLLALILVYSGGAALLGCALGFALGTWIFPLFIWMGYSMLYDFAPIVYVFDGWLLIISVLAALACSAGVTWLSCHAELRENPANLMRPKAPKAGKRILLEYIPFVWNRLSFLHKVSIRNIVRYKKRLFMMLLGVGGCTALIVAGLGLRDSISTVVDDQFRGVTHYQIAVTFVSPMDEAQQQAFREKYADEMTQCIFVHAAAYEAHTSSGINKVNVIATDDPAITQAIDLHENGRTVAWPQQGALLDAALARDTGVSVGETLPVSVDDTTSVDLPVAGTFENYVYHYAYMTAETYRDLFGADCEYSTAYILTDGDAYALGAALSSNSRVASVTVSEALQDIVDNTMKSLDYIVGLVVVCACALALVVLFNLCNISITERVREIATVKVLGFYHRETLNYVFREILLLTFCGALVGLPAGWALHRFIMQNIRISLVSFHIHVTPLSYALAFAATLLLAVAVCLCLIRKIDRISMAESLKSIE